jgi:group II intron reverse transcriptase/maturase
VSRDDVAPKGNTHGTQKPVVDVWTTLRRISEKAKQDPKLRFTSLAHLLKVELLREAYNRLRKAASPGVDGLTAKQYETDLEGNLQALHQRLREGQYRAQPVRRVYIEKENGKLRPLGIPALEDKIVQKAVLLVLEAIYEQDFLGCSYGFRPGRSQHDALEAVQRAIAGGRVSFVLDADIRGYFDNIVRSQLMDLVQRRVVDRSILRLLGKWLHVGVIEEGRLLVMEKGTPQGAVISPWMANVYLHYVLDEWVEQEVKPRLRGDMHLIRYADDFIACFQHRDDAERFAAVLRKRFERYGLELNEEKTRLIPFGRFAEREAMRHGQQQPPTFDFMGFTHYCARSRQGKFIVARRTARKRKQRAMDALEDWIRHHRHLPIAEQRRELNTRLQGHSTYYGVPTNYACLHQVYRFVLRTWMKWLRRRSQRRRLTWAHYNVLLRRFPLATPRITQRRTTGQLWGDVSRSRMREIRTSGSVGGPTG